MALAGKWHAVSLSRTRRWLPGSDRRPPRRTLRTGPSRPARLAMTLRTPPPIPSSTNLADRYVELAPRALRGVLASLALVMLVASLDSTAVGTALPRIVTDLRGNELYAWVFTIYLLTMTATMPVWGSLSDRFGRRPVLFIGLVIFLAGSALCGLSTEMWQLIVVRGIQGLGAGAIVPIS